MKTYAVYLRPKGSAASFIGSDTLFGAFCWAIRTVYDITKLEQILLSFNTHPKFVVSSPFPYLYQNNIKVRFYPKPLLLSLSAAQVDRIVSESGQISRTSSDSLAKKGAIAAAVEKAKPMKSVAYLSEVLFKEIVAGEANTETLFRRLKDRGVKDEDIERVGNAFLTKGERVQTDPDAEWKGFWRDVDVQRNEIDRIVGSTIEGRLYFVREIAFASGIAGLWFVLCTDDLDFIKPLLRYLEDTGIGGDRTVGKGHFTIPLDEIEEIPLPDAGEEANCFISLSRYLPLQGECAFGQKPCSYTVSTLRPKHESIISSLNHQTYKMLIRVFDPGSILPINTRKETGYYGQIIPVGRNASQGGWEVWHNGMTIPVFAKIRGEV